MESHIEKQIISLYLDGDAWCAICGEDFMTGLTGFGTSKAEALHELARQFDMMEEPFHDLSDQPGWTDR